MNILIANGYHLDRLGEREPEIYGSKTLQELQSELQLTAQNISQPEQLVLLEFFQSNIEDDFINKVSQSDYDYLIMNPGIWTHQSNKLKDAAKNFTKPFFEVHLSNILGREEFRKTSLSAPYSEGVIMGMGFHSYHLALYAVHLRSL